MNLHKEVMRSIETINASGGNVAVIDRLSITLSPETYHSRRNLIAVTSMSLFLISTQAKFNQLGFWGISFERLDTATLVAIFLIIATYEYFMFTRRLIIDLKVWQRKIIVASYEKEWEFGKLPYSSAPKELVPEAVEKLKELATNVTEQGKAYSNYVKAFSIWEIGFPKCLFYISTVVGVCYIYLQKYSNN